MTLATVWPPLSRNSIHFDQSAVDLKVLINWTVGLIVSPMRDRLVRRSRFSHHTPHYPKKKKWINFRSIGTTLRPIQLPRVSISNTRDTRNTVHHEDNNALRARRRNFISLYPSVRQGEILNSCAQYCAFYRLVVHSKSIQAAFSVV